MVGKYVFDIIKIIPLRYPMSVPAPFRPPTYAKIITQSFEGKYVISLGKKYVLPGVIRLLMIPTVLFW
jgi:hypothetical protein